MAHNRPSFDETRATISGTLRDGRRHSATLALLRTTTSEAPALDDDDDDDEAHSALVGTRDADGWWTKTILAGGAAYLQSRGERPRACSLSISCV